MLELLKDWKGELDVNDQHFENVEHAVNALKSLSSDTHIKLYTAQKKRNLSVIACSESEILYRITVRAYMTHPATPEFDFMAKWNNNVPMPMRTMVGTVEKETKGMVYMHLHGEGFPVTRCMRCGRLLTNPISKYYGIGPECMSKLGLVQDISEIEAIKLGMREIKWSGWIIKSAITEKEEI